MGRRFDMNGSSPRTFDVERAVREVDRQREIKRDAGRGRLGVCDLSFFGVLERRAATLNLNTACQYRVNVFSEGLSLFIGK